MRILMVSQFFPPVIGGEERMVEAMSTELCRRGHQVAVATLQTGDLPREEMHDGVRVHRVSGAAQRFRSLYSDAARPHAPPLPDPLIMRNLMAVLRRERPQVIHGHNWLAQSVMPLKRISGSSLVLSLHDYSLICATKRFVYADKPCSGPGPVKCVGCASGHYGRVKGTSVALGTRAMLPLALSTVDMFLPVSNAVARHTRLSELGAPWQVLPNFLSAGSLHGAANDSPDGLPEDGFTLFVGDLARDKGIELLLDAYTELPDAPPLVLIGRSLSARLSSPPPNVVVLGPRPHSEVMAAWRRCGLAVIPSITEETFGLAALEAMAAGRPVVAADHGGLPEIVADGETGLLVTPDDAGALRGALHRLHSDPELGERMGRAGRQRARRFTPATVLPQLEDVYRRVTASRGLSEGSATGAQAARSEVMVTTAPSSPVASVSAAPRTGPPPERVAGKDRRLSLGRLPALALASASGLALVSVADALSRSGRPHAELLFWLGLLVIFVPIVDRLASTAPRRGERVALVLLLGVALYLVKVLRDPFSFTYHDELVHQYNVLQILHSQALFGSNPILHATPSYPGLEAVTAALASTSGMSTFAAGLIVIGIARIILVLALFLLYETVTGSSRVAGLATALYAANPHYLFFTASFSYESLALPLALLAAFAVLRAGPPSGAAPPGWGIVAVAAILAVVVTHHMTSYGLVALLLAVCLVPQSWWHARPRRPWLFAATAVAATAAWLTLVASQTVGYLSPVITNAIADTFQTAAGESATRGLFSSDTGQVAPAWEHLVGIGSALIIVAALPLGLLVLWRLHRDQALALVLGCASVAYVGTLPLRLVPAAWETAVRASEFLFVGVALVLALAAFEALDRLWIWAPSLSHVAAWAAAGVLLAGGVISTSSSANRLAQPYRVSTAGADVDPPGVAVAQWAREVLGPGRRIAAEDADGLLLLVHGREHVFSGTNPPIDSVLQTPKLYRWQLDLLRRERIRYVVVDARRESANVATGYYFPRHPVGPQDRFPAGALTKFERAGAQRIYDGGSIVVDDLQGVSDAAATP